MADRREHGQIWSNWENMLLVHLDDGEDMVVVKL